MLKQLEVWRGSSTSSTNSALTTNLIWHCPILCHSETDDSSFVLACCFACLLLKVSQHVGLPWYLVKKKSEAVYVVTTLLSIVLLQVRSPNFKTFDMDLLTPWVVDLGSLTAWRITLTNHIINFSPKSQQSFSHLKLQNMFLNAHSTSEHNYWSICMVPWPWSHSPPLDCEPKWDNEFCLLSVRCSRPTVPLLLGW